MKEKKILVIRSATRILNQTLNSLKREFPQSRITVVAPFPAKDALSQDPLIDEVVPIHINGRMSMLGIGLKNIFRLRDHRFDLAVSLYNVDHGLGYSNIDRLLWSVNAAEMRGYNSRGKYTLLTPTGIIKTSLLEKTSFVWVLVNYVVTAVLFTLITLALCGEWCVRKFSPAREDQRKDPIAACLAATKSGQEG